jgi:transposase
MKKSRSKYVVKLSKREEKLLKETISKGKHSVCVIKRAQALLDSAQGVVDKKIAERISSAISTVERIRYRFFEGGIERALYDAPRSGQPKKLNDKADAFLVATACSDPPEGSSHWTLELLQKELIAKNKVKTISTVTIWEHLNNRGIKPWLEKNVVYPESNAGIHRKDGKHSGSLRSPV